MGQFLVMGLAHEIKVSRKRMNEKKILKEELRQEIEKSLFFDLNQYDEKETDDILMFSLKKQVMETDLIPFLEVLFEKVYANKGGGDSDEMLKELRSTSYTEWLDLADEKKYYSFQIDPYAEPRYIGIPKPFYPRIDINFNCIMLYYGDGKIATEGIDAFLDFFKYCLCEAFKEHPIAKSMLIYITG